MTLPQEAVFSETDLNYPKKRKIWKDKRMGFMAPHDAPKRAVFPETELIKLKKRGCVNSNFTHPLSTKTTYYTVNFKRLFLVLPEILVYTFSKVNQDGLTGYVLQERRETRR